MRSCAVGGLGSGGCEDEGVRGDDFEALPLWQEESRLMIAIVEGSYSGDAECVAWPSSSQGYRGGVERHAWPGTAQAATNRAMYEPWRGFAHGPGPVGQAERSDPPRRARGDRFADVAEHGFGVALLNDRCLDVSA
jgi:hypothetical protein